MSKQDDRYLTVIEGGGSTCRGILYDPSQNRIVNQVILQDHPCNIYRHPELTLQSLRIMLEHLGGDKGPLTLCLPGISHTENVSWLRAQLQADGFDPIHIASDAIAALLGAYKTLSEGQGIFIGGTGVLALGYAQGQFWRAGTPDTEIACGQWIARKAWDLSTIDPELRRIFESEPDMANASSHHIARFAPAIFQVASRGNLLAEEILQTAALSAADHMNRLRDFGITRFILCGSVAQALQSRIPTITESGHGNGLDGALKVALSVHKNPETLGFLTNLRRIESDDHKSGTPAYHDPTQNQTTTQRAAE